MAGYFWRLFQVFTIKIPIFRLIHSYSLFEMPLGYVPGPNKFWSRGPRTFVSFVFLLLINKFWFLIYRNCCLKKNYKYIFYPFSIIKHVPSSFIRYPWPLFPRVVQRVLRAHYFPLTFHPILRIWSGLP